MIYIRLFLLKYFQLVSSNGIIACMPPYISGKSKGFLVFACVVMFEALIFGLLQFYYYYRLFINVFMFFSFNLSCSRYPVAKMKDCNPKEENELELKNSNGV